MWSRACSPTPSFSSVRIVKFLSELLILPLFSMDMSRCGSKYVADAWLVCWSSQDTLQCLPLNSSLKSSGSETCKSPSRAVKHFLGMTCSGRRHLWVLLSFQYMFSWGTGASCWEWPLSKSHLAEHTLIFPKYASSFSTIKRLRIKCAQKALQGALKRKAQVACWGACQVSTLKKISFAAAMVAEDCVRRLLRCSKEE